MKKTFLTVVVLLLAWSNVDLKAQETITNAFDDLKRTGTVNEQDSEMRQATSDTALQKLLTQKPAAGYFCFAEDSGPLDGTRFRHLATIERRLSTW